MNSPSQCRESCVRYDVGPRGRWHWNRVCCVLSSDVDGWGAQAFEYALCPGSFQITAGLDTADRALGQITHRADVFLSQPAHAATQ